MRFIKHALCVKAQDYFFAFEAMSMTKSSFVAKLIFRILGWCTVTSAGYA